MSAPSIRPAGPPALAPRPLLAALVAAVCFVLGAATQRADLAAAGVPFAVLVAVALSGGGTPRGWASTNPERAVEGEDLTEELHVRGRPGTEVLVEIPSSPVVGSPFRLVVALDAEGRWDGHLEAVATRWGRLANPFPRLSSVDPRALHRSVREPMAVPGAARTTVAPALLAADTALAPRQLRALGGIHHGPRPGDGLEYAATRPWMPGDPWRRLNPRVSSRRQALHVDDRHPELNGDVTILVDTLVDDVAEPVRRAAVSLAAAVADLQRRAQDRVGLVEIGGAIRWLPAVGGRRRTAALLEWLVATHAYRTQAPRTVRSVPRSALPDRGLVVAITPFLDPRSGPLFADLVARRRDVAIVVVEPPLPPPDETRDEDALAWRLWHVERTVEIGRLAATGATVVRARPDDPPARVLLALSERRRRR